MNGLIPDAAQVRQNPSFARVLSAPFQKVTGTLEFLNGK
jgi:hypothetical protein